MPNILNDLKQKIVIDYKEWRSFVISKWNVSRDQRLIKRAIARAKIKNNTDGRTYYIMRDVGGGINELNRDQLSMCVRLKLFTQEDYKRRLERAISIVTSNKVEFNQYQQTQLKKEAENE